jgi:hypothetical protein
LWVATAGDAASCLIRPATVLYYRRYGRLKHHRIPRPTGKVYRINPDGSIPKDNPFVHTPGALPAVFTLGNRNVEALPLHRYRVHLGNGTRPEGVMN